MMRLIDADESKQIIIGFWNDVDRYVEGDISLSDIIGIVDDMPTIDPEQMWIPCSERPPENDEEVFVYLFGDSPYIAWMDDGRWRTNDFVVDVEDEPTEWMPLPKKEVLHET